MGQAFSGLAKRGAIAGVMGLPRPSVESNFGVQQNKALIMANFLSQKWLLPRRHFLRGLGVSLGLPMLDCMRPLCAAKVVERPRRGVFIYLPNGVNTHDYELAQAGPDYKFSRILAPLAKHRGNISPISGLHHPNAFGIAHSATQTWLTAAKHGPTDRNTISVDQLIAGVTGAKTRFPSLRQLQRRESMLDLVLEDAKVLAKNLSREDRGRLDQYLTAVREVEVRTKRAEEWLETPRPKIDSGTASRLSQNVYLERLGEHLRTMYDIIVLAFQTDMTRVVTFNTGNEGTGPAVPEIGISRARHSLSHHNGDKDLLQQLTRSDEFNVQQFAYFLDRLAEVRDGDGPLLDTTGSLYGSGLSYGISHGTTRLPLVLAGGAKLGFRHGSHVDFNRQVDGFKGYGDGISVYHSPVNSGAHFSNLLLTIAQRMGVDKEAFADSNAVVSEVLA